MAWSASAVSQAWVVDMIGNTMAFDYDADTVKIALYNNSITPDKTVASASYAYNAGVWANANEVTSSTDIPAGGLTLASKTNSASAGNITVDAADTASGSAATGTVYGHLVYSDTLATPVAKQGACHNWYGGAVTVTAGTLTIVHHANGLIRGTV